MFLAGKITSSRWGVGMLIGEKGGSTVNSKLIITWQIEINIQFLPLLKSGLMKKSIKKKSMAV